MSSVMMKLDREFEKFLREFAKKNEMSMRKASREIVEPLRRMRGKSTKRKIIEELRF